MRSRRFDDFANLPARERGLIGISVSLVHLLLAVWLLRSAGDGAPNSNSPNQGIGSALQITFVSLLPRVPAPRATNIPPKHSPIVHEPDNGPDTAAARADQTESKVFKVLTEVSEEASMRDGSQGSGKAINRSAAAAASPSSKGGSTRDNELASYHAAVRAAIRKKWTERTDRPFPTGCALRLTLATGGSISATSATSCDIGQEDRLQLEAAALMAQPLPYAGYEVVFVPDLELAI